MPTDQISLRKQEDPRLRQEFKRLLDSKKPKIENPKKQKVRTLEPNPLEPIREETQPQTISIPRRRLSTLQMILLVSTIISSQSRRVSAHKIEKGNSGLEVFNDNIGEKDSLAINFQTKILPQAKESPSTSPQNQLQINELNYIFDGRKPVSSSYVLKLDGEDHYVKPSNGEFAQQNDIFMRQVGLNQGLPKLKLVITKINTSSNKLVYTIGHARKPMPAGYKNIYDSQYFQALMRRKNIVEKEKILFEATKLNKIPLAKLHMLGVSDISNNGYNIFVNQNGDFYFPDTDIFANPTLPEPQLIDLMTESEYQQLRDFALSDNYEKMIQERLRLIEINSDPQDKELYQIFNNSFKTIRKIFKKNQDKTSFLSDVEENEEEYEKSGILDDYAQSQDYSSINVNRDGTIKINFESSSNDLSSSESDSLRYTPPSTAKKHPFFSSATTNPYELKSKKLKKPQTLEIKR